jgi:hypothetical protein
VMLLQEHVAAFRWCVIDFNGGQHLSWIHERDVRGYVFVEPGLASDLPCAGAVSGPFAGR